jgi:hypothetical protein
MGMGILNAPPKFAPEAAARVKITLAAGEVDAALPVLRGANGATERPRYVLISSDIAAEIMFESSIAAASATTNGQCRIPPNAFLIFDVSGYTHISTVALGAGVMWVAALTNQ